MPEELSEQVVEAQEPVATEEVAPSSAPEPTPEPEAPPVDTAWLDTAEQVEHYAQQGPPPQPQQLPPQAYPQPAQQQYSGRGPMPDGDIQKLVDMGPRAYMETYMTDFIDERTNQAIGPLMEQASRAVGGVQNYIATEIQKGVSNAKAAIARAYDVFNKDNAFRSNPQLQQAIEGQLKSILVNATQDAYRGDLTSLSNLQSINEKHAAATLQAQKAYLGIQSGGAAPVQMTGAQVASTSPQTNVDQGGNLTPAEEQLVEVRERLEPGYRQRFIDAKKETLRLGDFNYEE